MLDSDFLIDSFHTQGFFTDFKILLIYIHYLLISASLCRRYFNNVRLS